MEPLDDENYRLTEEQVAGLFRQHLAKHEQDSPARVEQIIERVKFSHTLSASGDFAAKGTLETAMKLLEGLFSLLESQIQKDEPEDDDPSATD